MSDFIPDDVAALAPELQDFMVATLVPAAHKILRERYAAYENGADIDIQMKGDSSPASAADREAEIALRDLIAARYPAHGIWGEEFGGAGLARDFVWVLDPLDGTKEFLARRPDHFGVLIGLLYKGYPFLGVIGNPLTDDVWAGGALMAGAPTVGRKTLGEARISCTNPAGMFDGTPYESAMARVYQTAGSIVTGLNAIGFALVADGRMDIALEARLRLHDIVALLPVLRAAGAQAFDFDGRDYNDHIFTLPQDTEARFNIITGPSSSALKELVSYMSGKDLSL